jgi:phage tail-like protein
MPQRQDPYRNFNFRVEIDGVTLAAFSEVGGLEASVDVVEYRTGSDPLQSVRKLPGLRRYGNIVLKHGLTQNHELWAWFKSGERRDGAIILLDDAFHDVLRWHFTNAFPCKWEGPALNARTSEVAIETIELAVEGIDLAT